MKSKILLLITLLLVTAGTVLGQTITVKGVVQDEKGEPITGATVRLKSDPKVGKMTGLDGDFTINAKKGEIIVVSYVGYITQEVAAAPSMVIKLASDNEILDEVVVTAMGISRQKKSIGYASQEIKADALQTTRQTDLNNALVGKV
ncbi:carboxypeptidase-like regulatory domain-containing protein, partial [Porphyromonas levii]